MAALAHMQQRQLQVEKTGSRTTVPNHSVGRLMYYLKCMTDVLGDCIPAHLTNYSNCYGLSYSDRQVVIEIAREYPPSKIPLFIPVDDAGDSSNDFLTFSSLEETITALGIQGDGEAMMALRRQVSNQHLFKVMVYEDAWARNNYYGPLREIQREEEQRRYRQLQAAPSYGSRKKCVSSRVKKCWTSYSPLRPEQLNS
uniref:Ras-associating domain-containing protein n=1 Tax=Macrostomum lignano TaxID=282301 RepID=A0A1I8J2K3_9PLAT